MILPYAAAAFAQANNGVYFLANETVVSAGGSSFGTGSMNVDTRTGLPASGSATNGVVTLTDGLEAGRPYAPPVTAPTTVTGGINDATASVTVQGAVNGVNGLISGGSFTAAGVTLVAGPNMLTITGTDPIGNTTVKSMKVYLDLPASRKTPRFRYPVLGTTSEPQAAITVNQEYAVMAPDGTFVADVPLTNGLNTITVTATDLAGNQNVKTLKVFVPLPPAMPTVADAPQVTTTASTLISGTKVKGTSIWINGQQMVAASSAETWETTVTLSENDSDNWLSIVAKDVAGIASAPTVINIVVDNLPPVLTVPASLKTNLNPFLFTGAVDDSLTQVVVNGLPATNTHGTFTVPLPLGTGVTAVSITATSPSPRNMTATASSQITLGTIPAIQAVSPGSAVKRYLGASVTFHVTAADAESDPIQYRLLLGGLPLGAWTTSADVPWTPSVTQLGAQRITAEAKDDFGGSRVKDVDVFVLRQPVQHP